MSRPTHSPAFPRVSVIIPTYNRPGLLRRAVESVCAQTAAAACEIIIVDDGSDEAVQLPPPGTQPAGLREHGPYAPPALRLIRRENGGLAAARNSGIAAARGEFVALLDDDDAWAPRKIELQLAAMARFAEAIVCSTRTENVDSTGARRLRRMADVVLDEPTDCLPALLDWNFIPPSSVLIRKAALQAAGGFDERLRQAEDYELWTRLAARGPFVCLSQALTIYATDTPGSLSGNRTRQLQYELVARRAMRRLLRRRRDCADAWRAGRLRCLASLRDAAYREREFGLAARAGIRTVWGDPLRRAAWEWRRLGASIAGLLRG